MFTAIIPMRKGSSRIKNKNLKLINGVPLYKYIINTATKSKMIKKIYINTDIDKVINNYKNNPKIKIIKRLKKFAGNCNMNLVIQDTINQIDENCFVQLHATNPFLKSTTLDKYLILFSKQRNFDSYFSVCKFKKRLWNKKTKPYNHLINDEPTTQNLDTLYEENSAFYIFTKKSFFKNYNRIGEKPKMINLNKIESFDIDDPFDLNFINALIEKKL